MSVPFATIKKLREDRAAKVAEAEKFLTTAQGENRDLTPEEDSKFDAIHAEADKLAKEIARHEKQYDAERAIGDRGDETAEGKEGKAKADEFKRELAHQPAATLPDQRGRTAEDEKANAEAQFRAFENFLRTGDGDALDDELRDLTTDDAEGGVIIAHQVYDQIIVPIREIEAVRRAGATVITVEASGPYAVPYILDTHDGAQRDEAAPDADVDPTFAKANLQDYRFDSDAIPITNQMLLGRPNLEPLLYRIMRQRIARQMQKKFTNGTGVNEPRGVAVAATTGVTAAATNAITYGELVGLLYSIPQSYRSSPSFAFMLGDVSLGAVRKIVDNDGRPLFAVSETPGAPDMVLGKRVIENPELGGMTAGSSPVIAGAFEHYMIKDVRGTTRIIRDPYSRANKDEVVFHGFHDAGGDLADPSALRKLTLAAS